MSATYIAKRGEAVEVVERVKEIRGKKARWGYRRVHAKLRSEGFIVNHKKIERIWKEYGYTLPARRKRKKVRTGQSVPMCATKPNQVWTYDFMFDSTYQGKKMKVLTLIDEFTRESLAIVPARSIRSSQLIALLAQLFTRRAIPQAIRSDNGSEFIAFELIEWLEGQGTKRYISSRANRGRTVLLNHSIIEFEMSV